VNFFFAHVFFHFLKHGHQRTDYVTSVNTPTAKDNRKTIDRNFMKTRNLLLSICLLSLNACVYVNVKTPLDKNVNNTELGDKVGKSKTYSVLWLFAWGDAGTAAAAKDGEIDIITHLDASYFSVLFGAYAERETIAYGN
jgi:hypothetical protein